VRWTRPSRSIRIQRLGSNPLQLREIHGDHHARVPLPPVTAAAIIRKERRETVRPISSASESRPPPGESPL
jgi:hypothetical protein